MSSGGMSFLPVIMAAISLENMSNNCISLGMPPEPSSLWANCAKRSIRDIMMFLTLTKGWSCPQAEKSNNIS